MDINDKLYVEIHPLEKGQIPHPHPVTEAHFDTEHVYKVLGMYNPSETSECYMILANTQRQIWFIPQRHLLAYGLIDSDEMFLTLDQACTLTRPARKTNPLPRGFPSENKPVETNGHHTVETNGYHVISPVLGKREL